MFAKNMFKTFHNYFLNNEIFVSNMSDAINSMVFTTFDGLLTNFLANTHERNTKIAHLLLSK